MSTFLCSGCEKNFDSDYDEYHVINDSEEYCDDCFWALEELYHTGETPGFTYNGEPYAQSQARKDYIEYRLYNDYTDEETIVIETPAKK